MGGLSTTFTASQGLLLMIPNMYKIAGELMPCVFHVAARALAGEALSIFGDHQDVMAVRQTGWALLSSHNVQQCQDLAIVAHMATLKARVPFVHFFDGFRTSHEVNSVRTLGYEAISALIDQDALAAQRARGLSPNNPVMRGSNQNPDVYMQCLEASNKYYDVVPAIVQGEMDRLAEMTGRQYHLFDYHGVHDAEYVVVQMGAGVDATRLIVDHLNGQGHRVGLVQPHLYRPWSPEHFLNALSVQQGRLKRVAVLDRTKEAGAFGEPMLLDVMSTIQAAGNMGHVKVIGGRWGLGSKEYTPGMALAVFNNLMDDHPKERFTVGIQDDVSNMSLPIVADPPGVLGGADMKQCLFYGLSGDGTVGANKNALKIVGKDPMKRVQGYFAYSSIKAGGPTISHLRFADDMIEAPWAIGASQADYTACSFTEHIHKYDMVNYCKDESIFVLNCPWSTLEECEQNLPQAMQRKIGEKNLEFYVIDAKKVAKESGMGKFTNNIMQTAFFRLSNVLPFEEAMENFRKEVVKSYSKRGEEVVQKNLESIDMALDNLHKIDVPHERWATLEALPMREAAKYEGGGAFLEDVLRPMNMLEGDSIPVSAFPVGGVMPLGTANFEKRATAPAVPDVDMDKCTQCNYCSFACPHAVIRPFLLNQAEIDAAPATLETRKATAGDLTGYNFRIQVSAQDCTGCEVCVKVCPDDALQMYPPEAVAERGHLEHWEYLTGLPRREDVTTKSTVKGSQFQQPLLEFHGACAGCGETPYVTLLTQLFGDRMIIANATGCSSIWGLPYGSSPYTTNQQGKGPAWANSLFEDNAEFGFGMVQNMSGRRERMKTLVARALETEGAIQSPQLYAQLQLWLGKHDVPATCIKLADSLPPLLAAEMDQSPLLRLIHAEKEVLLKTSQWIIGGDGWAYDIGFGGLDHVLASGANVNILILDTEVYSNTGGQRSKATPMGAIAKFATGGKSRHKKDIGDMAMAYGDVYVASIAMGANMNQTLKAFIEADAYPGTSLIMSYAPCIEHKIKHEDGLGVMMQGMKAAVDSGYWPLYRYNPLKAEDGKPPFELDAKKLKAGLSDYLHTQNRFDALRRSDPKLYAQLEANFTRSIAQRHAKYLRLSEPSISVAKTGEPLSVMYGSETGTTQALAVQMAESCRKRGYAVKLMELDDVEVEELADHKNIMILVATCGEGALPQNCQNLWEGLNKQDVPTNLLEGVNYTVFALGDRNYHHFCKAGYEFDRRFSELGGRRALNMGIGDDQDEEGYETGWQDFLPNYWSAISAPADPTEHLIPAPAFEIKEVSARQVLPGHRPLPPRAKLIPVNFNGRITPRDYTRSIRHLEFETGDLNYLLGDALTIYPTNDPAKVQEFLDFFKLNGEQAVSIAASEEGIPDERKNAMFEQPVFMRQVFEEVLDIFGRPTKSFMKQMAKFASDPHEKAELELLSSSEEGAAARRFSEEIVAETLTFYDLLRKYPSAKMSPEHLLTLLPCIKPRLYTIASSARMFPGKARLTVVINDWQTPSGTERVGLCTDYLERIGEQQHAGQGSNFMAACSMTSGTFNFPESNETPMVMCGLGTGVAPFIAFAQDRQWRRDVKGQKNGPMWLFYGCRHKSKDYILGDHLEALESDGILTSLRPAFSRDTAEKVYVHHLMKKEAAGLYTDLVTKKGYFYLCGQAGQLEVDVKKALVHCFQQGGNLSETAADKLLQELIKDGRYCVELY
eukprot:TRINITY_DN946_c0_g3_i1.p1 TRINITY_DN946_c0_g3~~TRINITY_DN946_c0_g3_i1.p1  ORF type:complete len:1967 (+),score=555.50 TRINITY_DN946_c0_g3_i1:774-5903(+)